jgi:hypothetical protein
MDVKQGERSVRTEYCPNPPKAGEFILCSEVSRCFYPYFSTVLTFSFVISFVSRQKK